MSQNMIAIVECANGNETIGTTWLTTAIFHEDTPLYEVRDWASQVKHGAGKLILSEPEFESPKATP